MIMATGTLLQVRVFADGANLEQMLGLRKIPTSRASRPTRR